MHRIERFGLRAVTGRDVFYHAEYLQMIAAENVTVAYRSSQQAINWAEWSASNPELSQILAEAAQAHAEQD